MIRHTFKWVLLLFVGCILTIAALLLLYPNGKAGPPGVQGAVGDAGMTGLTGDKGPKGDTGAKGTPGAQGQKGSNFWGQE